MHQSKSKCELQLVGGSTPNGSKRRKYQKIIYQSMPYRDWKRAFKGPHLMKMALQFRMEHEYWGPKKVVLCLSSGERTVFLAACLHHMERSASKTNFLTPRILEELVFITPNNLVPILRRLAQSRLLVDIESRELLNLAPNPIMEQWDLVLLSQLRKK
jgi:hypothetical protein